MAKLLNADEASGEDLEERAVFETRGPVVKPDSHRQAPRQSRLTPEQIALNRALLLCRNPAFKPLSHNRAGATLELRPWQANRDLLLPDGQTHPGKRLWESFGASGGEIEFRQDGSALLSLRFGHTVDRFESIAQAQQLLIRGALAFSKDPSYPLALRWRFWEVRDSEMVLLPKNADKIGGLPATIALGITCVDPHWKSGSATPFIWDTWFRSKGGSKGLTRTNDPLRAGCTFPGEQAGSLIKALKQLGLLRQRGTDNQPAGLFI